MDVNLNDDKNMLLLLIWTKIKICYSYSFGPRFILCEDETCYHLSH